MSRKSEDTLELRDPRVAIPRWRVVALVTVVTLGPACATTGSLGDDIGGAEPDKQDFAPFDEGGAPPPDAEVVTKSVCGNSVMTPDEACDDGNVDNGDGCSSDCTLEPGWKCRVVGASCEAAACGDGLVIGDEDCDDGNSIAGDGCSPLCRLEDGYKCPDAGKACVTIVCGDGKREGTEQCDDGNLQAFDGCSPSCKLEPVCSGGTCSAVCGEGLKFPNEECDDGNTRDGDGCSKNCTLEPGFNCTVTVADAPSQLALPIVYRDFLPYNYTGYVPDDYDIHPDFEQFAQQGCAGLIKDTLDAENKPVLRDNKACLNEKWITSATSFSQWYRDGVRDIFGLLVSKRIDATLPLTKRLDGSYVFDSLEPPYASTKFFPIDNAGFGVEVGMTDISNVPHNFHFTSELKYWFTYNAGTTPSPTLDFRGDDDIWVFINNHLAVDLGGTHSPEDGSVTLDTATATTLGLVDGGMYEITIFHAERKTQGSNYKVTLRDFVQPRSVCVSVCGDGTKTRTEACDDGVANNTGGYGKCKSDCTLGPRCGDGVGQTGEGEECDDGNLVNGDGCSATCHAEGPN